jgi:hypothetical protein
MNRESSRIHSSPSVIDLKSTFGYKSDYFILAVLFILALVFRLIRLMSQDIWFDEAAILLQIDKSFPQIWEFCKSENFPPLYSWLLKIWAFPSSNLTWLRLFDVLLGSAIPPIVYYWFRNSVTRQFAVLAALLCVLAIPLIYYSQIIRMYSLFLLLAIISYHAFQRALQTEKSIFWMITAVVDLLGFYTFLFMVFIIASQLLIIVLRYRSTWSKYIRPAMICLPILSLALFWIIPLITRYKYLESNPMVHHVTSNDLTNFLFFLGTGISYNKNYTLALILNLPALLGFLLSIPIWVKNSQIRIPAFIFCFSSLMVLIISSIGQSLFYNRYLIFLVPIYLFLAVIGWMNLRKKTVKMVGVSALFISSLFTFGYYQFNYLEVHEDYRYMWYRIELNDGHSFSKMSNFLKDQIKPGEIIIHYSNSNIRHFSYFPFLYYHGRKLPEYIYSKSEIPQYSGAQYLLPGEWVSDLQQLQPPPQGVWVVTLQKPEAILNRDLFMQGNKPVWVHQDNLPMELLLAGYRPEKTFQISAISAIHYMRGH